MREKMPAVWMGLVGAVGSIACAIAYAMVRESVFWQRSIESSVLSAVVTAAFGIVLLSFLRDLRADSLVDLVILTSCSACIAGFLVYTCRANYLPFMPPGLYPGGDYVRAEVGAELPMAIGYAFAAVLAVSEGRLIWAVPIGLTAFSAAIGAFWFSYHTGDLLGCWTWLPGFSVGLTAGLVTETAGWLRDRRQPEAQS